MKTKRCYDLSHLQKRVNQSCWCVFSIKDIAFLITERLKGSNYDDIEFAVTEWFDVTSNDKLKVSGMVEDYVTDYILPYPTAEINYKHKVRKNILTLIFINDRKDIELREQSKLIKDLGRKINELEEELGI